MTSMYQLRLMANFSAKIATFSTNSSIIWKSFRSYRWSRNSFIISEDVSIVAKVKRLSIALFLILMSGSFRPLKNTFKFSFKTLGQVCKWKGYALLRHSSARYLILGSLTPVNLTSKSIEDRTFSLEAASPIHMVSLIASNKMEWSELFLFTCLVTSV